MLKLAMAAFLAAVFVCAAYGRDDGRYTQNPLKGWFDSLRSERGYCCSDADGEETDYEIRNGAYWAPIDGVWQEVPDEAVIKAPNKIGFAMKWITTINGVRQFRCFIPSGGV